MRPIYVTSRDKEIEAAAIRTFTRYWRGVWGHTYMPVEQPELSPIDWHLHGARSPEPEALAEVKGRNRPTTGRIFETWMLEEAKVRFGFEQSQILKIPLYLIFAWDDDTYYAQVQLKDLAFVRTGGNFQRNDGMGDIAPMAHFPAKLFIFIGKLDFGG